MARVLLANFDDVIAGELAQMLSRNRHSASSLCPPESIICDSKMAERSCDLVILDVSSDTFIVRKILAELIELRAETGLKPMLLCVTRVYRGPRFEIDLENEGARLVYVH